MGQKIGRVELIEEAVPFTNLSRRAITNIWQVFNNIADGFGVSMDEFQEICLDLKDELNVSKAAMCEKSVEIFRCLDTDNNGLIDALEFFSTIAVLSGMQQLEIAEFFLTVYDFDGTESLSVDETVLSIKSVATGLCKLQVASCTDEREVQLYPKEELIEQLVFSVFRTYATTDVDDFYRMNIKTLCKLLVRHPDVAYWYAYFASPPQQGLQHCQLSDEDRDFDRENPVPLRRSVDDPLNDAVEWNVRCQREEQEFDHNTNPWLAAVAQLTPMDHEHERGLTNKAPNCALKPEWVYGVQSERCKNCLHYNYQGDLVYCVSKYAIVYSFKTHQQRIFDGHCDEILCLQMHPKKCLVASGDSGPLPRLIVWDSSRGDQRVCFSTRGFHQNGITQIAFSADGKLLASVGNDAQQSLSLHHWETNQVIFCSHVDPLGPALSCAILQGSNTVVVAGDTFVYFWSTTLTGYTKRAGNRSRFASLQPITVVTALHGTTHAVSGTASGQLLLWVDVNCMRCVKAHKGTVNALNSTVHGLLSAGVDSRIRMWTNNLEPGFTFDLTLFGIRPIIRSVEISEDGTNIVLTTKGGNLYEISAIDGSDLRGGPVAVGHSTGRLLGVSTHPSKFEFLTVGSDCTLRIFDMNSKTQLKLASFAGSGVSCGTYSPLGDIIAVGIGEMGSTEQPVNPDKKLPLGTFLILNEEDLSVAQEIRDSLVPVTTVTYSPEGDTLAVGCADGAIYLYAVQDDYELVGKCVQHTNSIISVDFSVDGEWMRSNSINRELLFFSADDASHVTNMSTMRDVVWHTHTCMYAWSHKGAQRSAYAGEEVQCVTVAPPALVTGNANYMACGTNAGHVRIHPFPCAMEGLIECHRYPAHSGPVASLCYSFDQERLISVGAVDRAIVQWRSTSYRSDAELREAAEKLKALEAFENQGSTAEGSMEGATAAAAAVVEKKPTAAAKKNAAAAAVAAEAAEEELVGDLTGADASALAAEFLPEGAETPIGRLNCARSGAVPKGAKVTADGGELADIPRSAENDVWVNSIAVPSVVPPVQQSVEAPELSLSLEHVYGYEAIKLRNSVRYSRSGNILYTTASFGVVYNVVNRSQKIFKFHTDAISAFAISSDGSLVATGQMGHRPKVAVWDPLSCSITYVVPEEQLLSVCALAFSPGDGEYLAVVGMDAEHTITVYNWRTNTVVCKAYAGKPAVLGVLFTGGDSQGRTGGGWGLTSYGVKEVRLWQDITTRLPSCIRPTVGEIGSESVTYLCAENFCGMPTLGTSDGFLYMFGPKSLTQAIRAHVGAVNAMHVNAAGTSLVSGGRDGVVRLWNSARECVRELVIDALIVSHNPKVRSVAFSADGNSIVVGTRGAEIFEVQLQEALVGTKREQAAAQAAAAAEAHATGNKAPPPPKVRGPHVEGHGDGEVWAMAAHPTKAEFVTAGDDETIRIWDAKSYTMSKAIKVDCPMRAVACTYDGKWVAVGCGNGKRARGRTNPKEGSFVVFKWNDLKIVYEGKDSSAAIRVVKFTVDGKSLAVGSDDRCIYVYNTKDALFYRRCTIRSHEAPISFIDFSMEGTYIMSVDATKRVSYSDASNGMTVPTPESLRDEKWATINNPVCWPVVGFWLSQSFKAEPSVSQKSWGGSLIASGSTNGTVSVARFPFPRRGGFVRGGGHAGTVSQLVWLAGDDCVLSVSGKDKTVLQWKCLYDNTRDSGREGGKSCNDSEIEPDGGHQKLYRGATAQQTLMLTNGAAENSSGALVTVTDSSSSAAEEKVDPPLKWMAMIAPPLRNPLTVVSDPQQPPPGDARLDFIHGVRLVDSRQTLRYNEDRHVVFVSSTMGVVFNRNTLQQTFYKGHKHALISLDVNSKGRIAATGELAANPEIHIWDAKTCRYISHFTNVHSQGVTCLSFSPAGDYLLSLGQDALHSLTVCYSPSKDWTDGHVICSISVSPHKMLWCTFLEGNEYPIAVGGASGGDNKSGVFFFRVVRGNAERLRGVFGKKYKMQPMLCAVAAVTAGPSKIPGGEAAGTAVAAAVGGASSKLGGAPPSAIAGSTSIGSERALICGTVTGYVYVFFNGKVVNRVSAHEASIYAISACKQYYITAGKDGKVKLWRDDFQLMHTFKTAMFTPRPHGVPCHAAVFDSRGVTALVGMRSGEVFELALQNQSHFMMLESHSELELHAISVNPQDPDQYVTAGDDGVVRVWSLARKYCIRRQDLECASRAVCWSPDGSRIVMGVGGVAAIASKDGAFIVLDSLTLEIIKEERKAKQYITDIHYSPSGDLLALGSDDGRIYIHDAVEYHLMTVVDTGISISSAEAAAGMKCAISTFDFSADSKALRIATSTQDLVYYQLDTGAVVPNPVTFGDTKWTGLVVPFSWTTQGVFNKQIHGVGKHAMSVAVTCVAVHPTGRLVAAGYDNGAIKLYKYPCVEEKMGCIAVYGVSTFAARIVFSVDGRYMIVIDACNRAILQYNLNSYLQ